MKGEERTDTMSSGCLRKNYKKWLKEGKFTVDRETPAIENSDHKVALQSKLMYWSVPLIIKMRILKTLRGSSSRRLISVWIINSF